jgi:hypothetical protein
MKPFIVKAGETIINLGLDFAPRLIVGETIDSVTVPGITSVIVINSTEYDGTVATASITIQNIVDQDVVLVYTVIGTQGSKRIGKRLISIQSLSD